MSILITGASGFLGSYFKYKTETQKINFIERSNKDVKNFILTNNSNKKFYFYNKSIEEVLNYSIEKTQAKILINCISMISAEKCELDPQSAYYVNSEIPLVVARISKSHGIKVIQISTDAVFGQIGSRHKEIDLPLPKSIYGKSKLLGENNILETSSQNLVIRTNFFGYSKNRLTLFNYFYNSLKNKNRVDGYANQFFSPVYIEDLTEGVIELALKNLTGILHLGGAEIITKYEFGVKIAESLNAPAGLIKSVNYSNADNGPFRNLDISLDSSTALHLLKPISTINHGIKRAILRDIV
jgi:dTDP-4-dehydrorhamnose reductase